LTSYLDVLFAPPKLRRAVILQYCATPDMRPGEPLWESLVGPARGAVDIYALTAPWGPVRELALSDHSFFVGAGDVPSRTSLRDAAVRSRAWLFSFGDKYEKIGVVGHGDLMPAWDRAVRFHPAAGRVRVFTASTRARGLHGASMRRQIRDFVTR
jgi:hypothetical protein